MEISLTKATIEEDDIVSMEVAIHRKAISEGDFTRSFEHEFREFLGVAGAVATNSCTSALILALQTLGTGPGDEVILPSYTCLAVLNAVVQTGATPRLTDNSYNVPGMNYNIASDLAKERLSSRTRAIIVPHMFGVPAEIDKIMEIGIPVIEDVTLSLGAWYKGKSAGAWGDISVCSFHASKMIACGEGGMLTSRSHELYERARYLNSWESEQSSIRLKEDNLEPYQLRYNFRLSDIAAALGISQLRKLPDFVARRRELAKRYTSRLSEVCNLSLPEVTDDPNVFHRYLVAGDNLDVVGVIRRFADAGIEVGRGVYPPLHRYLECERKYYRGAERAVNTLLSIPLYPSLDDDEVEYILQTSEEILSEQNGT